MRKTGLFKKINMSSPILALMNYLRNQVSEKAPIYT